MNYHVLLRHVRLMTAVAAFCAALTMPQSACHADVVGRLHVSVTDAGTSKPIPGASITLHDRANVRADILLTAAQDGTVLSPDLENHAWTVTTSADGYTDDTRDVTVVADVTTEVPVALQAVVVQKSHSRIRIVHVATTTVGSVTTHQQVATIPITGNNPQSLQKLVTANPGFVQSSVNAEHPRGEHASTTIDVDGWELPGALQGRAGQFLSPQVIESADVITGGYSPEYGGEMAAHLNLSLRAGPITPFLSQTLAGGGFGTGYEETAFGGQAGESLEKDAETPYVPRRFRYFVDISDRTSNDTIEPPQPDNQDAHNGGHSGTAFGNFSYIAGSKDTISAIFNTAPASTDIANRTGLAGEFDAVGQGYGYGGARNADGTVPGGDPTALGGQKIVLGSQQADGQDVYQNDDNRVGLVELRHKFSSTTSSLLSLGGTHSGLSILNHSPSISYDSFNPDGTLSVTDNSIEDNPNLHRDFDQGEIQGSVTSNAGSHVLKAGFLDNTQVGNESYQFIPQSQLALDALANIDPRLVPPGTIEMKNGKPVLDVYGQPVYLLNGPGETTPTLNIHRSGFYRAAYAQDTWSATSRISVNYGVRWDSYHQTQSTGTDVGLSKLEPRVNVTTTLGPALTGRLSYDSLFTQPPLSQGALLGEPIKPETIDQYDASLEKRITPIQSAKIAYYYKNIRNQDDTGILIPFTQIGAYTTLNYTYASVHGLELSYDVTPRRGIGSAGFLAVSISHAAPGGLDQTGAPAPTVNDHDQTFTLSTGYSYTRRDGASAGVDVYYGSGEASSVLQSAFFANALDNGHRQQNSNFNLRFASPEIGRHVKAELDVSNVFNTLDVLNFNSGFSGTRFEQGRLVMLSLTGSI